MENDKNADANVTDAGLTDRGTTRAAASQHLICELLSFYILSQQQLFVEYTPEID